jgi:putative transposase
MESTLETCRRTWNFLLNQRQERREKNRKEQYHSIFEQKQKNPYLKAVYSHVSQNVADRLDKSFKAFFKSIARYPKFKSFGRYDSFTYPDAYNGSVKLGSALRKTKLYLSKIGYVSVVVHRDIPSGVNKTCTIKRESGKWFAIFTFDTKKEIPKTVDMPKRPVGIDLGLLSVAVTSDGKTVEPLKPLKKNLKKLARLQRSLSRKKKGSQNRRKAREKVSALHWRIGMQRRDALHKLSRSLVRSYDFFVLEDLNIKGMLNNHSLARSISDAGWNQLVQMISYKASREGKQVVSVSPNHTSTDCSRCGFRMEMPLFVRTFHCERCNFEMDRDVNAAIGVLNRGLEQVGLERPELKTVETEPLVGRGSSNPNIGSPPISIGKSMAIGSQPVEEVGSPEVYRGA